MYAELLPFARDCGVKIATENMWNWDDKLGQASPAACSSPESFCAHIDALKDDFMVACLDIGHAEMRGVDTSAVEMTTWAIPRAFRGGVDRAIRGVEYARNIAVCFHYFLIVTREDFHLPERIKIRQIRVVSMGAAR